MCIFKFDSHKSRPDPRKFMIDICRSRLDSYESNLDSQR